MRVGHSERPANESGKRRHIRDLLHRLILLNVPDHFIIGIDQALDEHALLVGDGNYVAVIVDFP